MSAAVNQGVRVAEGARGEIVILGAWCSSCGREVMPGEGTGACPWCQRVVVDEDSLSARDLVKQIQAGSGTAPAGDVSSSRSKWTRETVIAAIRAFADDHDGLPPSSHDWRRQASDHPNRGQVTGVFGSWAAAIEAAGFDRPTRGGNRRTHAGVAQPDRAPADQADDAGSKPAPRSQQDPAAPPEREPTGGETETPSPAAADASPSPPAVPGSSRDTVPAEVAFRSDAAAGGTEGALELATLTNGDAAEWITRCDLEAERCTQDAARLVRRASGFKTIGDGLRILQETTA